eukprot:TRINITY_DN9351_c0_g1_i1.p1 TRINITY_DN9351_c0_g1~~TRINITY_DN9351_c0_g1_i1.p1  ORF type:complete len:142 (-),score=31.25 TRINITY_DN9351_c0_g1_i1:48-473(-)
MTNSVPEKTMEELICWEWQDVNTGDWVKYDTHSAQQIEDAYNNRTVAVPLNIGGIGGYTVDLSTMTQTRDSSGFQRAIRRLPPVSALPSQTMFRQKERIPEAKLETIKCQTNISKELAFAFSLFQQREGESLDAPVEEITL